MDTVEGDAKTVLVAALRRGERPVVTVPDELAAGAVVRALGDLDGGREPAARLLLDAGLLDSLQWRTTARLADLADGNHTLREADGVATLAVGGPEVVAAINRSLRPVVGRLDEGGEEIATRFRDRWADGEPVEIDTTARSDVGDAVRSRLGTDAEETLDRTLSTARGPVDPVAAVVWAAADAKATADDAVDAVEAAGLASYRTVYRRIDDLAETGVVGRTRLKTDSDGGRPPERLQRRVPERDDGRLRPAVRTALSARES